MKYQTNCFRVSDVKICPHCKNPKIIKKTYKKNHLGGFTKTESELDFRGKPIQTQTVHKRNASGVEVMTKDFFEYDNRERLLKHSQSINNSTTKNLIAQNKYDRRGQLISKKVGGTQTNAADRWQEVRYNYNIRGWLTYINNPMVLVAGENTVPPAPNDDLFAFNIRYTDPTNDGESLYNGNISQTIWKTASDNTQRGYNYTYDRLNRLRRADFYKQGAGNLTAYGEFISYDINGNITHLTRTTGDANDNDIDMDDLTYTYQNGNGLSNLLVNVSDAVTTGSNEGFKDGNTDPMLDDYEYDANGNMIKDRNKGISNISYNHLNLPTQIEFEGTNDKITYLYNAAGQKLKKTVVYSDSIKIVDYLDGFQYAGGELNFFPHPEGYVSVKRGGRTAPDGSQGYVFNYVFNYTDHLGNIRVSYSKDPQTHQLKILEENHYYPFGLKHSVYTGGRLRDFEVDSSNPEGEHVFLNNVTKTDYQYKYNGKELQDELGLGLYDYGWRNYDPTLGRWHNIDPLAEKYYSFSTYNYTLNNPVFFVDPDGTSVKDWIKKFNGEMIYDERVKDQKTASKYYAGSKYFGYGQTKSNNGTTTYGAKGKRIESDKSGNKISETNHDKTPDKATVMIENYVAVNNNGEWLLNLVSTGYVTKYKDSADGWVGAQETSVLAINGESFSEYGGATGLSDFLSQHSNVRNLLNERLGYEGLVLLGDAFQKSGAAIEGVSATLAVPTEGATTPGVALGRIMQVGGFGAKSYGNYKLGKKEQIWKDALMTATMKGGGALFKKMIK